MKPRPHDNKGAARLRELFPKRGDVTTFADSLGVHPSVVNRWRSGDRAPDSTNRNLLQEKLGIDWKLWDVALPKRRTAA